MGKILVAGGIKGGIGKSTLAANLAVLAARVGKEVLLVDADPQETTATWAAARSEQAGDLVPVTTVSIVGKQIRDELRRLSEKYGVVVVDAGARDTSTQRAALSVASLVLLPFPPRGPDLWTLDAVAQTISDVRTINEGLRAVADHGAGVEELRVQHRPILGRQDLPARGDIVRRAQLLLGLVQAGADVPALGRDLLQALVEDLADLRLGLGDLGLEAVELGDEVGDCPLARSDLPLQAEQAGDALQSLAHEVLHVRLLALEEEKLAPLARDLRLGRDAG